MTVKVEGKTSFKITTYSKELSIGINYDQKHVDFFIVDTDDNGKWKSGGKWQDIRVSEENFWEMITYMMAAKGIL